MGIDVSMYQNLLRPPKSVAEYDAEAMQNQTNRLALQMGQQKADEYTRGLADQEKLRGIVSQFGEDKTSNYNALLRGGRLSEAQDYAKKNIDIEKAGADVKHVNAQTDETHMKVVNSKMTLAKDQVNLLQTPEQAAQWVRSMYADPDLGKVFSHGGETPDTAIARIPTDPKAFAQWKMQASLGADKLIEYTTPNANTVANNATSVQTAGISAAASKYSADTSAKTAGARLAFDKEQAKAGDDPQSAADIEKTAQGIAAHRIAPLSSVAMLRPSGAKIMGRVLDINPTYDAGDFLAKNKALRDFATGPQGAAIQAANTGLNHLDTIEELAKAQKNGNIKMFNQIANRLAAETGQAAPTNLAAAITMVAPEVSKAVIGASGGQEERATFAKNFNPNGSPDQTLGGIGVIKDLMGGRMTEAQRTYERTTNRKDFRDAMLSPAAQRVLDRAHGGSGAPGSSKVIDFGSLK